MFLDLDNLHLWDWFGASGIPRLFFNEEKFEEDVPEDAYPDLIPWIRVMAFLYDAFGPGGMEVGIQFGAVFSDEIDSTSDIEVSITVVDDDTDSETSAPAS